MTLSCDCNDHRAESDLQLRTWLESNGYDLIRHPDVVRSVAPRGEAVNIISSRKTRGTQSFVPVFCDLQPTAYDPANGRSVKA